MGRYLFINLLAFLCLWKNVNGADCLIACTREMKPVCAQNAKGEIETFPNPCNLIVRQCEQPDINWRFFKSGFCTYD